VEGQDYAHCRIRSRVFGFKTREGNLTLEVRLPQDWTSAERNDVSGARLCEAWRKGVVTTMKRGEVGIDVTVEISSRRWASQYFPYHR
jgi:hypothetical protein